MTGTADGVLLQAGGSGHELLGTCSTFPTLLPSSQGKDRSWQVALWFYTHAGMLETNLMHRGEDSRVLCVVPEAKIPAGTTFWLVLEVAPNHCPVQAAPHLQPRCRVSKMWAWGSPTSTGH